MFNTGDWCKAKSLTFEQADFEWMRDALNEYMSNVLLLEDHQIIAFTLTFLIERKFEIAKIASKYTDSEGLWHVRARHVSLKSGIFGTGPYARMDQIIKSIITGQPGHQCIEHGDESLTLYFFPWKEIHHEFRVFVYDGVVKAISNPTLMSPLLDVDAICACALEFSAFYPTYAADVALLADGTYYAIEPNCINEHTGLGLFEREELEEAQRGSSIVIKSEYVEK